MKAFGLICLLFPVATLASVAQPNVVPTTSTTYTCYAYTDNEVDYSVKDIKDAVKTDNAVQKEVTEIVITGTGYTVKKNKAFTEDVVMPFPDPQVQLDNFASNSTTMIFRKRSDNNLPYFIVLSTAHPAKSGEKPSDNPINRMVTLAQCEY